MPLDITNISAIARPIFEQHAIAGLNIADIHVMPRLACPLRRFTMYFTIASSRAYFQCRYFTHARSFADIYEYLGAHTTTAKYACRSITTVTYVQP